jgi:hypothetical protein
MRKGFQVVGVLSLICRVCTERACHLVAHIRIWGTAASVRIPGAEVVATNAETKVSTELRPPKEGRFEILRLPIHAYAATVSRRTQVYDLEAALVLGQRSYDWSSLSKRWEP